MRALIFVLASLAIACGNSSPPSTPAAPSAAPADSTPPAATASASAAASAEAPSEPPKKRRPLEIHNACNAVVTVVFGEDPKADTSGKRSLASGTSIDGPRDAEGKMTVHLLDEKGEKVATVHVTRGMKKVEVGASCRTLDAH
jgi:hypothetical protein